MEKEAVATFCEMDQLLFGFVFPPQKKAKYLASSNPHPPHSRAYSRYNKFLRILETSTPNSRRLAQKALH